MFETYLDDQDSQRAIWLGHDNRNGEWVYEVTVKVPGGVRHVFNRVKRRPSDAECIRCALDSGYFSARPYRPGQACDGSIDSAALTLYLRFCETNQIDALALLRQAYPDEDDWDEETRTKIIARGEWEGVAVPETWDEAAIAGALESLTEIKYHSLRTALEELLDEREQAGTVPA